MIAKSRIYGYLQHVYLASIVLPLLIVFGAWFKFR